MYVLFSRQASTRSAPPFAWWMEALLGSIVIISASPETMYLADYMDGAGDSTPVSAHLHRVKSFRSFNPQPRITLEEPNQHLFRATRSRNSTCPLVLFHGELSHSPSRRKKERKGHCALPACGASTPLGRKSEKKGSLVQVGAFHVSQSGLPPPHPNPRFMGEKFVKRKNRKEECKHGCPALAVLRLERVSDNAESGENSREQHDCGNVNRREKKSKSHKKKRAQKKKRKKDETRKKRSVMLAVPVADLSL
ncbi:hypothetical protein HDV62DRAFT_130634 [Trichoderma sp. SZMC 28011]